MAQIHKSFSTEQVKDLFSRYVNKQIERVYIQELLGIQKAQFFRILKEYRNNPVNFSINYTRQSPKRLSPYRDRMSIQSLNMVHSKLCNHLKTKMT